jgi:hypothetical protein
MENLKYPIGKFDNTKEYPLESLSEAINYLEDFPKLLRELSNDLSDDILDTPYRPNGWTARQVVHHIADSHANMYIRVKCALTEVNPTIKGYSEGEWAKLPDSKLPIESSLKIIEGLHERLVFLFKDMKQEDFEKTFYHNGYQRTYILRNVIALYRWHSEHHLEHIKLVLN